MDNLESVKERLQRLIDTYPRDVYSDLTSDALAVIEALQMDLGAATTLADLVMAERDMNAQTVEAQEKEIARLKALALEVADHLLSESTIENRTLTNGAAGMLRRGAQ